MATIKEVVRALKRGAVVAFPTESFYGIAADATNPDAVKKVFAAKGRGKQKPIALVAASVAQVEKFFYVSAAEKKLMREYWPGALTMVLRPKKAIAARALGARLIGVRVPKHAGARRIAAQLGRPITATSANLTGKPATKSRVVISRTFRGMLIVDGVCGSATKPSTLIRLAKKKIHVLRIGAVRID